MNRRRLLQRILQGAHHNIAYSDLASLLSGFGFHEVRIRGSHHLFQHPLIPEQVNLQPQKGQAKAYEIREILRLIRRYNLVLEEEA